MSGLNICAVTEFQQSNRAVRGRLAPGCPINGIYCSAINHRLGGFQTPLEAQRERCRLRSPWSAEANRADERGNTEIRILHS